MKIQIPFARPISPSLFFPCLAIIVASLVAPPAAEFRITSIRATNNDIRLNWNAPGGSNYVLQVVTPLSSNFVDLGPSNYVPNGNDQTLGYTHLGARTSAASRYYRVKAFPALPKLEMEPTNAVIGVGMTNRYKIFLVYPDNFRVDVTGSAAVTSADAKIARYTRTADGFAYVRGNKNGNVSVRAVYQEISNSVALVVSSLTGISVEPPLPINDYVGGSSTQVRVMGTFANGQTFNITPSSTFDDDFSTRVDYSQSVVANVANSFALVTGQSAASYDPPFMAGGFQASIDVNWCNFTSLSFMPENPRIKVGETLTMILFGQGPALSGDALSPSFNGTFLNQFFTAPPSVAQANLSTRQVTGLTPGFTTLSANIDSGPGTFCDGALNASTSIEVYCPDTEQVDAGFNPGTGPNSDVSSIVVQPDGKVLIVGFFSSVSGVPRNQIARLNANGTLDTSFDPSAGANGPISALALQADGRVVIGGFFTTINGTNRNGIARLNANGGLDSSFDPGTGANDIVRAIVIQPDGRILIGGNFTTYNGTTRNGIARIQANGPLDASFNTGSGAGGVNALALQGDGRVILGGAFTVVNGTNRGRIARLNPNGGLDTSFNPGSGTDCCGVYDVTLQPDGKLLIGGDFSSVNSTTRYGIARLNTNGALDTSFNPVTGFGTFINSLALQPDGNILVGGNFTTIAGSPRKYVARLTTSGALDADIGACGGSSPMNEIAIDPCRGHAYLGGGFTTFAGLSRSRVARLAIPPAPTPVNDNFGGRSLLAGLQPIATADNRCASKESGEDQHGGNPGGKSLWWSWSAPVNGLVTISTCGSAFDTALGVYTGDSVNALSLIASNDNSLCSGGAFLQSQVQFQAVAGTVYQIAVDGVAQPGDVTAGSGLINLSINFEQTYYAATFEAGLDGCVISNSAAIGNGLWHRSIGRGADSGHSSSNSLYYGTNETYFGGGSFNRTNASGSISNAGAFVSPVINLLNVPAPVFLKFNYLLATEGSFTDLPYDKAEVQASANNGPYQVIAGNRTNSIRLVDSPTAIVWTNAFFDLSAFAGQQVRLRFFFNTVDSDFNSFEGWYVDDLLVVGPVSAANDPFASRINLSGRTISTLGSNLGAGKQAGETNHTGNAGGASVWWTWTAPASGPVTFHTCGSDFDTLLAVYTGTSVSALSPVASNDDSPACGTDSRQSRVQFTATAGVTYQIAVDGYKYPDESAARTGTVILTVQQ